MFIFSYSCLDIIEAAVVMYLTWILSEILTITLRMALKKVLKQWNPNSYYKAYIRLYNFTWISSMSQWPMKDPLRNIRT